MITVDFARRSIKPGFRILDMGCGSGRHTCAASQFDKVIAIGSPGELKQKYKKDSLEDVFVSLVQKGVDQ